MSKDSNKVSEPIAEGSEEVKNPVSEPIPESFIPDAGLSDVAAATNDGITEQLHLHNEKLKPAKKSESKADMSDINNHPKKWYETDLFGKVKTDADGKPKKKNGRPKKPRNGDKLVGGGVWPPAAASTINDQAAQPGPSTATPGEQPKRMDLGKESGDVLIGHMERLGQAIGGDKAKPTPEEKKVISESLSASLGEWQIYPPLALLVFGGLFLMRVVIESKFSKSKEKDQSKDGGKAHSVSRDHGKRQDSPGQKVVIEYPNI